MIFLRHGEDLLLPSFIDLHGWSKTAVPFTEGHSRIPLPSPMALLSDKILGIIPVLGSASLLCIAALGARLEGDSHCSLQSHKDKPIADMIRRCT